ncbi:transmembrane signal receptor [Lithospermum erythrorhizon]|uniref:Transmembrane signal receptor n=1 Tax=Lithospermum erythrorhizon TaxID=34254 RepID=A0AAV3RK63_LITER
MSLNRMFSLTTKKNKQQEGECLQIAFEDSLMLWHQRYGHLNFQGLRTLKNKNMVIGLPKIDNQEIICTDCLNGKQTRQPIPKQCNWRADKVLELIHSDICGPITPTSNSGKKYFLTFIDDCSRKGWVYLLNKSEAFSCFKGFKSMVEKESGELVKCLRTDRGGEYMSTEFVEFCKEHGIKRQLTTAYTPQQNGVAERRNRTIMNMVRSMLSTKEMPKYLWTEAVVWTVYVLNRCPTLSVKDKTPQEAWSGTKPTVEHLKVWGCLAHVHIPKVQRSKLDKRSAVCVFLGMSSGTKGYRLYNTETNKIIVSRDVVFEESKKWNWNEIAGPQEGEELKWEDDDINEPVKIHNEIHDIQVEGQDREHTDEQEEPANEQEHEQNTIVTNEENDDQGRVTPAPRRSHRTPRWMRDYVSGDGLSDDEVNLVQGIDHEDPMFFEEAVKYKKWREAMDAEINSIVKNNTWTLTELPKQGKKIGVKWIYKTKRDENGKIIKHKARLVAKGYVQREGIDYTEVFAPVARMDTVRMFISNAANQGWKIHQLDVKSAFLHGELSEEVFIEQPEGYVMKGDEHMVYQLHKALYGLKQAPRAWFSKIERHFLNEGFQECTSENTLFTKRDAEGSMIIVSLYVDDLIITGNNEELMLQFKASMVKEFDMTDLGRMNYFLGIEVVQLKNGIFICQKQYAETILKRFGMTECNVVSTPIATGVKIDQDRSGKQVNETQFKQMVGSLMYLTSTRPDIMYATCLISRYMSCPTELHLQVAKRIMRYLKGTTQLGIYYQKSSETPGLQAYTDSDYAGDYDDRKSTSGYAFILNYGAVAWASKKQPIVTLSTTEAEFVAATACVCQLIWMKRILKTLGHEEEECSVIYCDNSSTIKLSRNPVMHGRSKHIDVRYHFLRDQVKKGRITLEHCSSEDQVADILTKAVKVDIFLKQRAALGMMELSEVS